MSKKIKKIALIISSGLGNAVMLIPLLKKLKEKKTIHTTLFLDSPFVSKDFLIYNDFQFDEIIELTKINKTNYLFTNMLSFDTIYLDYSSSSIKNLIFSRLISKNVIALRKNIIPFLNVEYRFERENTHAAVLNLQLFDEKFRESDFDVSELKLVLKNTDKPDIILDIESSGKIPVIVQASSANLTAKYKNWPTTHWIHFLNDISLKFPDLHLILMGDENEIMIGKQIENEVKSNVSNLIGKTNLIEMCSILNHSKFYIGLDSGLMHLAVTYDIPTFSIFGASSYHFVGYEKFDSKKHKVIYNPISCWPCHGFSQTNKTRVSNPGNCPDFKCLSGIKSENVFKDFFAFVAENNIISK